MQAILAIEETTNSLLRIYLLVALCRTTATLSHTCCISGACTFTCAALLVRDETRGAMVVATPASPVTLEDILYASRGIDVNSYCRHGLVYYQYQARIIVVK